MTHWAILITAGLLMWANKINLDNPSFWLMLALVWISAVNGYMVAERVITKRILEQFNDRKSPNNKK